MISQFQDFSGIHPFTTTPVISIVDLVSLSGMSFATPTRQPWTCSLSYLGGAITTQWPQDRSWPSTTPKGESSTDKCTVYIYVFSSIIRVQYFQVSFTYSIIYVYSCILNAYSSNLFKCHAWVIYVLYKYMYSLCVLKYYPVFGVFPFHEYVFSLLDNYLTASETLNSWHTLVPILHELFDTLERVSRGNRDYMY